MNALGEILHLLRKELLLEWRTRYAIGGILLYVLSTVFIVYAAFIRVEPATWNTLYWVILLFAAVNAVTKSFIRENSARQLYYYQMAHPLHVLAAKIIYNVGLLALISLLTWGAMAWLTGNPVKDYRQFILALWLGSAGFAITFTFISAIAAKADNSATLMAILSFPLVIPIVMTLTKLSANALRLMNDSNTDQDILVLVAIDMVSLGMAILLFPFLWRD
ncbi:MAG TPA: heme exporter protein CcmB [Flavilitoribacter sp.]|nr:heme exporter protein CcmB [Lewinella sp.]MCB9280906.1 heme exporter protein CcmB [Lewinellaceae bacterium]HMQ64127.1 heme exporter protein CcmB [Flavilitoribacter sp.]HMQ91360.1 heme exporter protein CcmB [Flavilitoribacter sp.]